MPEINVIAGTESQKGPRPEVLLYDVWDLNGQHHRMDANSVTDMVNHLGWHRQQPIILDAASKVVEPAKAQEVIQANAEAEAAKVAAAAAAALAAAEQKAAVEAPVDLTSMSREGLARFAKEKFDLDVDVNWSHEQILDAIQVELGQ